MHGGRQLFSLTLLVEVEGNLMKQWVALYALARVWRRGAREKHTHVFTGLTLPGVAWRGEGMGAGA
jgi:hypothetical protein